MTKKRVFKSLVSALLLVTLLMTVFVACEPTTYVVKFMDGDTVVKEITVEEGQVIAEADLPVDLTKEGFTFNGWFNGEVAFDKTAAIVADVTYVASWTENTPEAPDEPMNYIVTFKDGDTVVKTATVKEGTKIATADIPANPVKEGYTFNGWFNGEVAFDANAVVNADVTYVASWTENTPVEPEPITATIIFKNGDETVKAITAIVDQVIDAEELPSDPEKAGYTFDGWFNGEVAFDEEAVVTGDATYVAAWTKSAYIVNFVNSEDVVSTVYVAIAENAVLAETDIPEAAVATNGVFVGWYNNGVKAEVDVAVTADVTFAANFIYESMYEGSWVNAEDKVLVTVAEGTVDMGANVDIDYTFNTTTGALEVEMESRYVDEYSLTYDVVTNTVKAEHTYWDDTYEEMATESSVLTKVTATGLAGYYRYDNSYNFTVLDNGVISLVNGSAPVYGIIYETETEGTYKLDYKRSEYSSFESKEVTFDEAGHMYVESTIYVKGSTAFDAWYNSDTGEYIYQFTVNDAYLFTYENEDDEVVFATIASDVIEDGVITTMTYGDVTVDIMFVDGDFIYAGSEKGVYTGEYGEMTLDGFGNATLVADGADPAQFTYSVNAKGIVIVAGVGGFTANAEYVYTQVTADAYAGTYDYIQNNEYKSQYKVILDGFGGATYKYIGSYSTSVYEGTYTVSEDTLTIADCNYSVNKTFIITHEGKAFETDGLVLVLETYEVTADLSVFFGYFEDEDGNSIYIYEEYEILWLDKGGLSYRPANNWDGSALIFNAIDDCAYDAAENTNRTDFTVVISENGITVSHSCRTGLDMDGYTEYATISVEYAFVSEDKPTITTIEEALIGTWSTENSDTIVVTDTIITVNGTEVTNLVIEEDSWAPGHMIYVFNVGADEFQIFWGYDECPYYGSTASYDSYIMTKAGTEEPELDAFAGSWTNEDTSANYYQYTLTFDGQGNVTVYGARYDENETVAYTIADNVATFSAVYYDWTCTLQSDGTLQVQSVDSDGYTGANLTMDKVIEEEPEEPELDVFAGSWTNEDTSANYYQYTLTFDGQGNVTVYGARYNENETVAYTIADNVATFSAVYYDWTCTLQSDGTLLVQSVDSDGYTGANLTMDKVTSGGEEEPEAPATMPESFIGTWSGTKDLVEYKVVVTVDTIVLSIDSTDYTVTEFEIDAEYGDVLFSANDMSLALSAGYEEGQIFLIEIDSYSLYVTLRVASQEPEDPEEPATIPTSYVGTWGATKNEVEYKAVITETSIVLSIGGTEYTVTEFTIDEYGDVLFSANDMNLAFSDDYGADTVVLTETDNYSIYVSMTPVSEEEPEEPEQPEVITTIAGALAGSEGASVSLSGTVSGIYEAWSTQFNNMAYYLTDGTDTILVFRAGGDQVGIGDEVSVVGTVTDYNGTNQVAQGGTTTLVNAHVCSTFTDADCYNAAVCTVCGEVNGEALGHTDEEDNNGVCDRCGTDMESAANEVTVTAVYTGTTTTNMTGNNDAALIGLDATIFNVVSTKLGGNHVGLNKDGTIRLYASTTGCYMTISVVDGYKIVSVKVTLAASNGGTIVVTDGTNTITATDNIYAIDGSTTVLTTSGTTQVRIASIEIVYTTASGSTEDPTDPEQPEVCSHEYDNACDADCNVCSATREVGDHVGGTATCIALAVCTECGAEYGELAAHDTTFHEAVESTCVVYGNVEYWACSTCGKNFVSQEGGEEILNVTLDFDPNNHGELVTVDAVAATCQSTGLTEGQRCLDCGFYTIPQTVTDKLDCVDEDEDDICDVCGSSLTCVHANFTYSVNTEDETKHDKVCGLCNGVVETVAHVYVQTDCLEPSCTDGGTIEYTCSEYCGHVKYEDIEATGHSTTDLSYTYGDETAHYVICNVCDQEIDVAEHAEFSYVVNTEDNTKHDKVCGLCNGVVATSEHNYVETGYTSPDCDDAGSLDYTCSECGDEKSEEIPANGHSDTQFNYSVNAEDNTKHNVLCGICNAVVGTEDHNYEEVDRVAATCVDEGLVEYDCTACGHDYLEELPVDETAHSTTEFTYELNTEDNTKHNVLCGLCGDVIETVDHTYEEVDIVAATCVDEGLAEYDCTACGHDYLEELPIDETAHAWDEGKVTVPATCTQAGEMTFTCTYDSTHTKTEPTEKADHNYVDGTCTNCPAISKNDVVATFEFGANGSASHNDGNEKTTYSETNNGYTFSFSGASKVYSGARDQMGNSALKLGTSSVVGTFTFEVPNDVTTVIINVAKYKANTTKITVNGTSYTLENSSNDGAYDKIVVDTTSTKTVSFTTVSGGARCMINSIQYVSKVECEHENAVAGEVVAPTCTEQGYTVYTCTCGTYNWDYVDATGHTMTYVAAVASTCKTEGNIEHWTCSVCGVNHDAEVEGNVIDNVIVAINPENHENLVVVEAVAATCQDTGLTEGQKCDACGVVTIEQTVTEKVTCVDENGDELCDVCGNSTSCEHDWDEWSADDDDKHSRICTLCLGVETEEHTYGDWTVNTENSDYHDHTCSVCNHTETATHNTADVSYVKDPVENWHNVICNDCGGVADYEEHTTPTYEVNATDSTKHDVKCDKCGVIGTEDHTVGYKNNDGSTHDTYCTVCNYDIATGVAHVDNGTGSCDCGKSLAVSLDPRTYTFSNYTAGTQYAENEEHVLDDNTTIYTTQAHFTSELRLYSSSTYNGYAIIHSKQAVSSISVNAGYKADAIVVYATNDPTDSQFTNWTKVGEITTTSSYNNYELSLNGEYKCIALDVKGTNQVRIKSLTLTFQLKQLLINKKMSPSFGLIFICIASQFSF